MFSLKRQLKKTKNAVRPSVEFRAHLMSELSLAYDKEYGCPQRRPFMVRFASVSLASLVLFFTMGAGVYAYESPEVTEGHPLYFMKSGIEFVRGGVARSPEARAQFHADMMERRLEEGEFQFPIRPEQVPPVLNRAAEEFASSINALEEGVDDEATREKLIEGLSIKRARYQSLHSRVGGSEEENGEIEPLRVRIEGHHLSEDEFTRLFGASPRATESSQGR